ncbi:hypothetical protein [Gemmobacter sp.]|nr:hypothetical protein [Gemmobacter sp.]
MPSPFHHIVDIHPHRQRQHRPIRKGPGKVELGLFAMAALLYALV